MQPTGGVSRGAHREATPTTVLRVARGRTVEALDEPAFRLLLRRYSRLVIDLGTGDGRYVLRTDFTADTLCIGIDADAASMQDAARRASRKGGPKHGTLFVVAAAEALPGELDGLADLVHVQFPWGKLLEGAVRGEAWLLDAVRRLLKDGGRFELILGYDPESDDARVRGVGLPPLSDTVVARIASACEARGLAGADWQELAPSALARLQSSWARRLAHGPRRPVYRLTAVRN
jgi:16S rRNA (adenine(1408)-N(1))-methyltransferase